MPLGHHATPLVERGEPLAQPAEPLVRAGPEGGMHPGFRPIEGAPAQGRHQQPVDGVLLAARLEEDPARSIPDDDPGVRSIQSEGNFFTIDDQGVVRDLDGWITGKRGFTRREAWRPDGRSMGLEQGCEGDPYHPRCLETHIDTCGPSRPELRYETQAPVLARHRIDGHYGIRSVRRSRTLDRRARRHGRERSIRDEGHLVRGGRIRVRRGHGGYPRDDVMCFDSYAKW